MKLVKGIQAFFTKFSNDWCMNLAGLLAYNFLTAIFPLLLAILALAAFVVPDSVLHQIADRLNSMLPSGTNAGGAGSLNINFYTILQGFRRASGPTLIVSLAGLLWTGSNLFGVMENCFSIIFRTKDRNFIKQKVMAIIMVVILAILVPLSVVASSISGSFNALTSAAGNIPGLGLAFGLGGYLIGVLFAFILFEIIYVVVPNMPIEWKDTWRGALFAAVLFEIVNLVFPFYIKSQHSQFGSFVGLLAILTFWFWVLSLILLLGAEMNSFSALGQRALSGGIAATLHDVQVHGRAPGAGEDADAPPAGHPVSPRGERVHAEQEESKAAGDGAQGERNGGEKQASAQTNERHTSASVATPRAGRAAATHAPLQGTRSGGPLLVALAVLAAVLAAVRPNARTRVL